MLSNSEYASLFIRSYLDNDTIHHGRLLYHALKSDYIHLYDYKCVLNIFNNKYKLCSVLTNTNKVNCKISFDIYIYMKILDFPCKVLYYPCKVLDCPWPL